MKRIVAASSIVSMLAYGLSGCALTSSASPNPSHDGDLRRHLERADRAYREARLIDAEVLYRELSRTNPAVPDVWLRLGSIYVRQGQLEAADRAYRDGMRVHPQDGRLWFNLALVQLRQSAQTLEVSSEVLPADSPYREPITRLHRAVLDVSVQPAGGSAGDVTP